MDWLLIVVCIGAYFILSDLREMKIIRENYPEGDKKEDTETVNSKGE